MIDNIKNKFKNYKPYINGHEDMKISSVLIPIVKKIIIIIYYLRFVLVI